jgi:hypothetical protein
MSKTSFDSLSKHPYWWDSDSNGRPLGLDRIDESLDEIPFHADCVIVGAGYTGLSAALTLARGGRSVVVLDAAHPGYGCPSRNGGLIGPSFHMLGLAGLEARLGKAKAAAFCVPI